MSSIWVSDTSIASRPALSQDLRVHTAVIGGGLAGILTAFLLQQKGLNVAVLEADHIGCGQTGNTTAKVTAQHGACYARLIKRLGFDRAKAYAQANQQAIASYRQLIQQHGLDCDFQECSAYLYSQRQKDFLLAEADAAQRLGLPVKFTRDLPIPAVGGVRMQNQAQFHPRKLLSGLAQPLTIFEGTRVSRVGKNSLVANGFRVEAEHIIFACHYPFVNIPGYFFLRMHQERSYVLALTGASALKDMYYSIDSQGLSLRQYNEYLLVGGGSHRCGENRGGGRYQSLEAQARLLFPQAQEAFRWSAQDCITLDGVPYIGPFSRARPNWYVATGFGKWGMTSSMVAAQLLCRTILKTAPAKTIFTPLRFALKDIPPLLSEGGHAAQGLCRNLTRPKATVAQLPVGHGGVVRGPQGSIGACKSSDGKTDLVPVRCPHMGCQLTFNPDEQSWDCPCHGSRFTHDGTLINGPAQTDLAQAQPGTQKGTPP